MDATNTSVKDATNTTVKVDFERFEAALQVIDLHAAGEPCRVVVGGFPEPEGSTMIEKRRWVEQHCDNLRRALMLEPRGHGNMFGALLCKPVDPQAHLGVIFMDTGGYLNMCGHGTMAVATAAVEAGLVEAHEGANEVVLDAPAGLVCARVDACGGVVEEVSFRNVPSFVYRDQVEVNVGGRTVSLTVAFGGSFFALVDAAQLDIGALGIDTAPIYARLGVLVREAVNRTVSVKHPERAITTVDLVEFFEHVDADAPAAASAESGSFAAPDFAAPTVRHLVVFGAGSVDRSPCGTGLSAKLAALYHRGEIALEQPLTCESFIGTRFRGIVEGTTSVGEYGAIIPRISGRAFITGMGSCLINPDDPLKNGFLPQR